MRSLLLFVFVSCLFTFSSEGLETENGSGFYPVKGIVVSKDAGMALKGVNVELDDETIGTITDQKGEFTLWLDVFPCTLRITTKDYQAEVVAVNDMMVSFSTIEMAIKKNKPNK